MPFNLLLSTAFEESHYVKLISVHHITCITSVKIRKQNLVVNSHKNEQYFFIPIQKRDMKVFNNAEHGTETHTFEAYLRAKYGLLSA